MITLLKFLLLRRLRHLHPELFDGAAALRAVHASIAEHAGDA